MSSIIHNSDDRLRFCLFQPYIRRPSASNGPRTQLCRGMSPISIARVRPSAPDDVGRILDGKDACKSEKRIAVSGAARVPCGRCGGHTHCGGRTGIGDDGVLAPLDHVPAGGSLAESQISLRSRSPIWLGSTRLPDGKVNVELHARPRWRRERPTSKFRRP